MDKLSEKYQICSHCILDINDDSQIQFDQEGVCNYCHSYDSIKSLYFIDQVEREKLLYEFVRKVRKSGRKKKYDCVLGMSGGVDSSFLAYKMKELGLRPLIVHFDNGWNSESAVKNIENIVTELGFDLYTYVVDWEEFKDIQLSFLKASVVDIELITDYGILAALYLAAKKNNIKYILTAHNYQTEAILPKHWYHYKLDYRNIREIHKKFGNIKVKTFPHISFWRWYWNVKTDNIHSISLLNLMDYNKEDAKKIIVKELNWKDYGWKHGESIFTKFYQNYILPKKFGIDKRKAHLSSLICSGQMSREEALNEMKKALYDPDELRRDMDYILKKWELSQEEFDQIMNQPPVSHLAYPSYLKREYRWLEKISNIVAPWKKIPRKIFL